MGLVQTVTSIKPAFWLANTLEAGERLAYFGIRAILPLMMVSTSSGLGLSMLDKGIIYGIWALIQCIVPMVSGGFSEYYGYKKSLVVAFIINLIGYVTMANILNISELIMGDGELHTTLNFWLMMISGCTIGLGTAIFKPPVGGVVAKSLNEKNSGFGFGLFYWVVNIGGLIAPFAAASLRGTDAQPTWHYVFYGAAFVTIFNLIVTAVFFREPEHTKEKSALKTDDKPAASTDATAALTTPSTDTSDTAESDKAESGELKTSAEENIQTSEAVSDTAKDAAKPEEEKKSASRVFIETLKVLWNDKSMLFFLIIISGFWLMFMQLWDVLPNFLDEWVDRRDAGQFLLSILGETSLVDNGALKPEIIINIDSTTIILLVLPLSALFQRFRMMTALIIGMVLSVFGFVLSGMTMSGTIACLAIFIFAIGEVICSPKFDEYIGMTAPEDKKAIYMGFTNIPFAVGWAAGNILSGTLYDSLTSKHTLAMRYLTEHHPDSLATITNDTDLVALIQNLDNLPDTYAVNDVLWQTYSPWSIWIVLGAIGVASMIGMIVFYYKSGMAEKDEQALQKVLKEAQKSKEDKNSDESKSEKDTNSSEEDKSNEDKSEKDTNSSEEDKSNEDKSEKDINSSEEDKSEKDN